MFKRKFQQGKEYVINYFHWLKLIFAGCMCDKFPYLIAYSLIGVNISILKLFIKFCVLKELGLHIFLVIYIYTFIELIL